MYLSPGFIQAINIKLMFTCGSFFYGVMSE